MTYNYSLNSQNINLNNLAGNSQAQYAQNMQNEPVSIFQTQNKATSNNIEADDGKISFGSKIKNIAKGIIKSITTMFSSPKNFSASLNSDAKLKEKVFKIFLLIILCPDKFKIIMLFFSASDIKKS